MIKNILVTGGAGFIGSHIVVDLANKGYNPIILDNFSNSSKGIVPVLEKITGKTLKLHEVDIKQKEKLFEVFDKEKIDAVIHLAAYKAVGESVEQPLKYYENNISGIVNLLSAMKEHNVFNFIFSSSATVYGDSEIIPIPETAPTGNVTNPYGRTKVISEEILKDTAKSDKNWKIIALRYFNPIGAHKSSDIGEYPNGIPNNLFPYVAQVALGKLPKLNVFGNDYDTPDGTCIRDYIHVCDLAEGHTAAVKKFEESENSAKNEKDNFSGFDVYNLGTGQGYSVLDVVKAFEKASGLSVPLVMADRRAGDVPVYCANAEKANKELGWTAKLSLEEMCKDGWNWYKKHPNGIE